MPRRAPGEAREQQTAAALVDELAVGIEDAELLDGYLVAAKKEA